MRLSALIAALAVAAPIGLCAGSASAQFFQGQSVLFGRPHGSVYEGAWCAREDIGSGNIQEDCTFDPSRLCRRAGDPGLPRLARRTRPFAGYGGRHREKKRRAEQLGHAAISSLIRGQLFSPSRPVSS